MGKEFESKLSRLLLCPAILRQSSVDLNVLL